jgi:hypothetical protein
MSDDPEQEYRRGYYHGAWDVIEAVSALLAAEDETRLREWFAGPVYSWKLAALTGQSKRSPDGQVAVDMVPPRHLLWRANRNLDTT